MKSIIKNILSTGLLVLMTSCDDGFFDLDKAPLDQPSSDTFFTTAADAELFANRSYDFAFRGFGDVDYFRGSDLHATTREFAAISALATGNYTPSFGVTARYWRYDGIRHAYEYLERIDDIEIDAAARSVLDGVVYYSLAYQYFTKFKAYEDAIIVTEVLEIDESDLPSSPKEEVLAEALRNVDLAISNLPSERTERGRLTKLAAMTLKTDMLLYAASRWNGTISNAGYQDAVNAASTAIGEANAQGYSLAADYQGLFIAELQSSGDAQGEIILEDVFVQAQRTNGFTNRNFRPSSEGGISAYLPRQEMVDMFECTDGLPINLSPLYDSSRPFNNRDPRLSDYILYPGAVLESINGLGNENNERIFNPLDPNGVELDYILGGDTDAPKSGYVLIKYWDRLLTENGFGSFIVYRLADLYLMLAEAKNEATGPDAEIYDLLSQIRQRSGMPAVDAATHPTQGDVRALIRNERVVELSGEGKRYWDVRRWGIGEQVSNVVVKSMHISTFNPDGSFAGYVDKIFVGTDPNDLTAEAEFNIPSGTEGGFNITNYTFEPRNNVWPVPQDAIESSIGGLLQQHPLW